MISSRKRHRQQSTELDRLRQLRLDFMRGEPPSVDVPSKHAALVFLAKCRARNPGNEAPVAALDAVDYANSRRLRPTREQLGRLWDGVAAYVLKHRQPRHVLEYLAGYFLHHERMARILQPGVDTSKLNMDDTWLSWDAIRKALVVPDTRKLALEIVWKSEIRPGEYEMVRRITNATSCSPYTVVQNLRTVEYITKARTCVIYGTLEELHEQGWLNAFVLAIVQTRMQSRCGFDWMQRCVEFEYCHGLRRSPDPYILVLHGCIAVVKPDGAKAYEWASTAFHKWCAASPRIVDGRYDVSISTI